MVSHPETGSDSPIGSDQDRGRDKPHVPVATWLDASFHFSLKTRLGGVVTGK